MFHAIAARADPLPFLTVAESDPGYRFDMMCQRSDLYQSNFPDGCGVIERLLIRGLGETDSTFIGAVIEEIARSNIRINSIFICKSLLEFDLRRRSGNSLVQAMSRCLIEDIVISHECLIGNFVEALSQNIGGLGTLSKLELPVPSIEHFKALGSFLSANNCNLNQIIVHTGEQFNVEWASILVDSLRDNKSLEKLDVKVHSSRSDRRATTPPAWNIVTGLVISKGFSSHIMFSRSYYPKDIHQSNHTLRELNIRMHDQYDTPDEPRPYPPFQLQIALRFNEYPDKSVVAAAKIIEWGYRFHKFEMKLFPYVVQWHNLAMEMDEVNFKATMVKIQCIHHLIRTQLPGWLEGLGSRKTGKKKTGKKSAKRRVLRDEINGMTKHTVCRLARRGGVERIYGIVYN
jgi:hypothetical protein